MVITFRGIQQEERVSRGSRVDHDNFCFRLLHDIGKSLEHGYFLRTRGTQVFLDIFHVGFRDMIFPCFVTHLVFVGFQYLGLVDFADLYAFTCHYIVIKMIRRVGRR